MQFGLLSQIFTVITFLMSLGVPVIALIYFYRQEKISFKVVAIGAVVWYVFSRILETVLHSIVLTKTPLPQIQWAFVIYGAFAAGIFEELGRYLAFTYLLPKNREWKDGIAFGIGQGGLESLLIGAVTAVRFLILGSLLNSNSLDTLKLPLSALNTLKQLLASPSYYFLVAGFERIFAFVMQIALTLVVLYGVRKGKKKYLLYAILLHAVFDLAPVLFQVKIIPLLAAEVVVAIFGVVAWNALRDSKKYFQE